MPTGYTHCITEGATFEEFAWKCARGMGALIMMRDEPNDAPIPERFEPSDYHMKEAGKARAELARLEAMTDLERAMEAADAHIRAVESWAEMEHERHRQRAAYQDVLDRINAMAVPASHAGFKEFMRKQVTESIEFDTGHAYEKPQARTVEQRHAAALESARYDIDYHTKRHAEEVEMTEERNRWLATLRQILPPQPKSNSR